jgi:hypothetical protein
LVGLVIVLSRLLDRRRGWWKYATFKAMRYSQGFLSIVLEELISAM